MNINIGDELYFEHYGITKGGIVVDVKGEKIKVKIPSDQIISIIESEVICNAGQIE